MNKRDIFELFLKLIGSLFLIYYILYIPNTLMFMLTLNPKDIVGTINYNLFRAVMIIHLVLALSISWLLFYFSAKLAAKVYSKKEDVFLNINIGNKDNIFRLSLKIIGVYFIISNIISLFGAMPMVDSFIAVFKNGLPLHVLLKQIFSPLIGISLGLYLLLSGEIFVKLAYKDTDVSVAKIQN